MIANQRTISGSKLIKALVMFNLNCIMLNLKFAFIFSSENIQQGLEKHSRYIYCKVDDNLLDYEYPMMNTWHGTCYVKLKI